MKKKFLEQLIEMTLFNKKGSLDLGGGDAGDGASGNNDGQEGQTSKTSFSTEDFEKYSKILEDRVAGLEKSIAKSNVGGEQSNEFIEAFKEYQKSKTPDVNVLTNEIETLKQQIRDRDASDFLTSKAKASNLSDNGLKALMKLVDKSSIFEKDGKISDQKASDIVANFVKEFPEFIKVQTQEQTTQNFFSTGAKKQEEQKDGNTEADLFKNAFSFLVK